MVREPEEEELPPYYDELIHADKLDIDVCNPRNQKDQDSTLKSIEKTGLREPLIVREKRDEGGQYVITDGWNRYKCLVHELNWSHIPCNIKDDEFEALRETDRATEQNPFTKYQEVYRYGIWVQRLIDIRDLTENEAIEEVYQNSSSSKQVIRKRYEMFQLPDEIHTMMKKPDNRENTWKLKCRYSFHEGDGALNIYAAYEIAKAYIADEFDDERANQVASASMRANGKEIIEKAISECREYNNKPVQDVFDDVKNRYKNPNRSQKTIKVGTVHLGDDAETIYEYCKRERGDLQDVVKEALKDKAEKLRENYGYLNKVDLDEIGQS